MSEFVQVKCEPSTNFIPELGEDGINFKTVDVEEVDIHKLCELEHGVEISNDTHPHGLSEPEVQSIQHIENSISIPITNQTQISSIITEANVKYEPEAIVISDSDSDHEQTTSHSEHKDANEFDHDLMILQYEPEYETCQSDFPKLVEHYRASHTPVTSQMTSQVPDPLLVDPLYVEQSPHVEISELARSIVMRKYYSSKVPDQIIKTRQSYSDFDIEINIDSDRDRDPDYKRTSQTSLTKQNSIISKWSKGSRKRERVLKKYTCETCSLSFDMKYKLVAHDKTHIRLTPFSCKICGEYFGTKSSLFHHENTHTRLTPTTYTCKTCGQSFDLGYDLAAHEKIHTQPADKMQMRVGETKYTCKICGEKFGRLFTLQVHIKVHRENKHKCEDCGKTFRNKNVFDGHKKVHAGAKYICKVCHQGYYTEHGLEDHEKTHIGEEPRPEEK